MPIYEYACDDCGYTFERVASFDSEPVAICPTCGGAVRRVISSVGVIFKGSGWYITDSKRQLTGKASPQIGDGGEKGEKAEAKAADHSPKGEGESKPGAEGKSDKGERAEKATKADRASEKAPAPKRASDDGG